MNPDKIQVYDISGINVTFDKGYILMYIPN